MGSGFVLFGLVMSMACESSWARDQTCTPAVTMLDPQPTEPLGNSLGLFFFCFVFIASPAANGGSQAGVGSELQLPA